MAKEIEEVLTISSDNFRKNIKLTEKGILDLALYGATISSDQNKYIPFISFCNTILKNINTYSLKKINSCKNFIDFIEDQYYQYKMNPNTSNIIFMWDIYFDTFKKTMNYHISNLDSCEDYDYKMFRVNKNKEDFNSVEMFPFDFAFLSKLEDKIDSVSTLNDLVCYSIIIEDYIIELKRLSSYAKYEKEINKTEEKLNKMKKFFDVNPEYKILIDEKRKKINYNIEKVSNPYNSSYELLKLIFTNANFKTTLALYNEFKNIKTLSEKEEKTDIYKTCSNIFQILERYNLKIEQQCLKNIIKQNGEKKTIEGIFKFIEKFKIENKMSDLFNDDYLNLGGRNA